MDKYEYNLRIDQIRQAVEKRDVETATKTADKIDWRKEKEPSVLMLVADAYELSHQYSKAKEVLLIAYEKTQMGRQLAYRLALVSAKAKEFDEAQEFYQDFVEIAPRDTTRYVLLYKIAKAKGEPINKLIAILEEYIDIDMEEKWMYELAKLYHLAGDEEKCVDLCDEMSLWFSHGEYVRRALDLKKKYRPLTKTQEENYLMSEEKVFHKEEKNLEDSEESETPEQVKMAVRQEITDNIQEDEEDETDEQEKGKNEPTIPFLIPKKANQEVIMNDTIPIPGVINVEDINKTIPSNTVEEDNEIQEETFNLPDDDIEIKPLLGDGFDTMDIQAEIAKNMEEIMSDDASEKKTTRLEPITMTLDPLFKLEGDGQIGLDIAEPTPEEKQITGQLSIQEVLRNLEERGILKPDTVNKTVQTMDDAAEVVDKAAEEAAIEAKEVEENTTVIEDIGLKDLAADHEMEGVKDALESYADDAVHGFVFTEEIDSEAIEKALKDTAPIPILDEDNGFEMISNDEEKATGEETVSELMEKEEEVISKESDLEVESEQESETGKLDVEIESNVEQKTETEQAELEAKTEPVVEAEVEVKTNSEEEKSEEASIAEENKEEMNAEEAGEDSEGEQEQKMAENEVPILDLGSAIPIKKVPTSAELAGRTADLSRLFADLDEKTKRELGIDDSVSQKEGSDEISDSEEEKQIDELEGTDTDRAVGESKDVIEDALLNKSENAQVKTERKDLSQTTSLNISRILVSDEEMAPFESFKTVNGLEQKIKDTVSALVVEHTLNGNSKTGNIMILGDDKSGKTTMAIELIKLVNKKRQRIGRRIAKVDSSVLNSRGIKRSMKKLIGSDLIIENAQHLRKSVINELLSVGQYYTDDMLIVFEGETSALKTMRKETPDIKEMFNHCLVIKEYDVKEWVAYAKKYASTLNYMVDEMGTLALYKTIDDFYGKHQGIDQNDVETVINRAIKRAKKKMTRRITNVFSGKNDDTGMDILKESDFKNI